MSEINKKQCIKCNDMFIPSYGGLSKRHSCRHHKYNLKNICIDCGCDSHTLYRNCYHIVKYKNTICIIQ